MTGLILGRLVSSRLVLIVYAIIGVLVANAHHYFAHLSGPRPVISAVLAVIAWPAVLAGVNVHIK